MKTRFLLVLVMWASWLSSDAASLNHEDSVVTGRTPSGLFTLEVRDVALGAVIKRLAAIDGAVIHHSLSPERRVTATCVGPRVSVVLECLLGPSAGLVVAVREASTPRKGASAIEEIWIPSSSLAQDRNADSSDAQGCASALHATGEEPKEVGRLSKKDLGRTLTAATDVDADKRAAALARLAVDGDAHRRELKQALESALTDDDARVRAQAVFALMRQSASENLPLLMESLHDSDPDVRLMAVDSAPADLSMRAFLEAAAGDDDPTVRQLAEMKLGSMGSDSRTK